LEEGKTQGEILDSVDIAAVADLVISLLQGAFAVSAIEHSQRALESGRTYMHQYFDILVMPEGERI
jgi:hypothetical protein